MSCLGVYPVPRIICLMTILFSLVNGTPLGSDDSPIQDGAQPSSQDWTLTRILQQQADKRNSWNKFYGSWGKKNDDFGDFQDDSQEEEYAKRAKWSNLHGSWGKRVYGMDEEISPGDTQRHAEELYGPYLGFNAVPLKREWAKFAGTWGKRPFATRTVSPRSTNWSSLRGSWGKRGGDWAQLRGVWGKRNEEAF